MRDVREAIMTREERLFRIAWRERRCMYRTIHSVGHAHADFDDIVQHAMIDAWRLISTGRLVIEPGRDERLAIRTWLPYVARIAALHYKRDRTAGKPIGEALDFDVAGPDVIARLEARDQIRVALLRTNRMERAVLEGSAAGDTLAEIGAAVGVPADAAARCLYATRRVLKKRLARGR